MVYFSNFSVLCWNTAIQKMLNVMQHTQRKETQSVYNQFMCIIFLLPWRISTSWLTNEEVEHAQKYAQSYQFAILCFVGYVVVSLEICMDGWEELIGMQNSFT